MADPSQWNGEDALAFDVVGSRGIFTTSVVDLQAHLALEKIPAPRETVAPPG